MIVQSFIQEIGMKSKFRLSLMSLLLLMALSLFSQDKAQSAILSGRVIFAKDSVYPLKPYSIIFQKRWPITFSQFEQGSIDSTDFCFQIKLDLDQLTYGTVRINFFPEIDTTALDKRGTWMPAKLPDDFYHRDGMFIREYAARVLFGGTRFVIEPGDSLHMIFDFNREDLYGRPFVHFSGTGGGNNNFHRTKGLAELYNRSFKLPLEEGLENEDSLMGKELARLTEARDSLSPGYYHLCRTGILFDNLGTKHTLIRASLYGSDRKIEEKRALAREYYSFMDTLTLRPEYLSSLEFRGFLGLYLEYINRSVTGRDIPHNIGEETSYLAQGIFDRELLKAFLYKRLKFQMDQLNFYSRSASLYEEFRRQFPDTPEAFRLAQIHRKRFPVSSGQPAPDLELIDSLGRTTHLSRLKGKVVLITSSLGAVKNYDEQQAQIEALREKFSGTELVFVVLHGPFQRSGASFSPLADYYVDPEGSDENLISYRFLSGSQYTFVVRKNGIIEDCVNRLNISEKTITKLNYEPYTLWTRLGKFVHRCSLGIIIVLSLLLLVSIGFYLWSRLRQRRQELLKKQLNSELKAIRSQLNPHFLFNSLNSIQNFINKSDPKTANIHLSRFALLMRKVIEISGKESATLKEELDFNQTFIELEQLRYGFKCKFDIESTLDLYNVEIPSMIIQPFIENAIVHGMADLGEKGELFVILRESGKEKIYVEIRDNGKGFEADVKKGFGLKSSRERIDLINSQRKKKIDLQIESAGSSQSGKGTIVRLFIPKKY